MSLFFGKLFKKRPYLFGKRIGKDSMQELPKPTSPPPRPIVPYSSIILGGRERNRRILDPICNTDFAAAEVAIIALGMEKSSLSEDFQPEPEKTHDFFDGGSSGGGGAERSFDMDTPSTSND